MGKRRRLPWEQIVLLSLVGGAMVLLNVAATKQSSNQPSANAAGFSPSPEDTTGQRTHRIIATGRTRRAKAADQRARILQSLQSSIDTTGRQVKAWAAIPRDSSARLEQFKNVRVDVPYVSDANKNPDPLYASEPPAIVYVDQLDSLQWIYHRRRLLGGYDTRIPYDIPLEEYTKLRLGRTIRENWESMAHFYLYSGEKKAGLGELFGKVTNIEIPVPKNPLFSIFGPNIIRLQINGSVDVHAAFRNTKSDLYTASPLGQSRNEPDFNQQVQVSVKGEIGDKLKIDADWNTQRTFEYENQLRVKYTGYEDEIVQSVEAGNVSLTSGSSFIGSSSALFGIKSSFQFGPLKLTAVASQKKGQIKELTVSGGASSQEFTKRLEEYSTDHYFVDTVYRSLYERNFLEIPPRPDPNLQIRDIEVWVSNEGQPDPQKDREIVAFMDSSLVRYYTDHPEKRNQDFNTFPDSIEVGRFLKLEVNTDYNYNASAGIVSFNRPLQPTQAIAVAYIVSNPDGSPLTIGTFGSSTTADSTTKLIMKLVRPRNLGPQMRNGWKLMLKNRYPLGGRGIKKEGFELYIDYNVSGQPPVRTVLNNIGTLEMFGLDRFTGDGTTAGQDQKFDYLIGYTIDEARGELIFPTLEPFRASTIKRFIAQKATGDVQAVADSFAVPAVYDTTKNGVMNDTHAGRFIIHGVSSSAIQSTYNLGTFNIVEGSVEVIVDGQRATPNVDYVVDYIVGQVTIKNQSFLVPGRNVQIKYEANDLFQLASKTLLAARGDIDVGKNSSLGFTIMNLNQKSLSDKVRLGEEPISNTIMGVDGGTTFDANFLTKALNYLPGIQTTAPSQISFRGEAAYMSPDPNTRKSPIPGDNGSGLAYIDDFEGARRTIPFGTGSSLWKDASPPFYIPGLDLVSPDANLRIRTSDPAILPDTTKIQYKARMSWFNVLPSDVTVKQIWPNKSVAREQEQVSVLNFYYRPGVRGPFNYSMNLENMLFAHPDQAWAGVQHLLGTTTTNLLDENIGFVELWVNIVQTAPGAKMRIDLGFISEDVIPNKKLDTEDGLDGGIRKGILNPAYDWGLDGVKDDDERAQHKDFLDKYGGTHPEYVSDPSGDDWSAPPLGVSPVDNLDHLAPTMVAKYDGGNGTEGNSGSELGRRFPDTEDLNGNNVLDRTNAYYEYEIPLDTNDVEFQKMVTGGGSNGWYQIRIPLVKYARMIGEPSFANIEGVRMWLGGATGDVFVRMTEMNLVGNQWEELVKNDSSFKVSVVNVEENTPRYTSPVGNDVLRTKDPTRPDQNIISNEQSLNLIIHGLMDGQQKQAIKRYSTRPLDVFSYRTMKMYIHGEEGDALKGYNRFNFIDTTNYDVEVFFRFGTDSLNYYEYRAPVHPGWDPANEIVIRFSDLTAIKLLRDSAGALTRRFPVPNGPIGSTYQVRGEPTLTNIRYISIGVENPVGKGTALVDGELWADELRLVDVDDTPGWAYRFDTGIKFADVASIQFSYTDRDPFFHSLEERFGSRVTNRNWNLSASIGLERFLPESWSGTSLGFSYSHVEAIGRPRYMPGTDILVDQASARVAEAQGTDAGDQVRLKTENLSVTETYAIPSIKLNVPLNTWLVTETINRMSMGFSYNTSSSRSPTMEHSRSWGWNFRFNYGIPFGQNNFILPFSWAGDYLLFGLWKDVRFYFTPKQITTGFTINRSRSNDLARNQVNANIARSLNATRSLAFNWQFYEGGLLNLGTDYQVDISSNLVGLELDRYGRQRTFTDILGDMLLSDRLISFGTDLTYGQSINLNSRLVMPTVLKLDKIFTPRLQYSTRYDWSNNPQAGDLGKSAGWGNNITFSLDVAAKTITDELLGQSMETAAMPQPGDTSKKRDPLKNLANFGKGLFKATIFGFDKFNVQFTEQNRSSNSGVLGRPGFGNLFARVPFVQSSTIANGPSLLYQLGLSTSPHGDVVLRTKGAFPFVTGYTVPGLRAPNGNLSDVFSQNNNIQLRTSRPLWEGASLELNWKVGWSYNEQKTIVTDSIGNPYERNRTVSGDVERSFFTLPPVFVFKFFKTSMEQVDQQFEQMKNDPNDTRSNDAKLSQAFVNGLEGLPLMTKIFGQLAPRANWSIHWDGLEKLPLFTSFASRVSLDHSYTSTYRRRWRISPQGDEVTESQSVSYGFSPLVGVNFGFKEFGKGNLNASVRYNLTTNYDLVPSAQNVAQGDQSDVSISGGYSRTGFEIPFFGLSLSNDIDVSFTYTYSRNARKQYDFLNVFKPDGQPLEGSNTTRIEPRVRYILSSRVTASLYYRYTKISPDDGGSKIPGSTTNEGGLDIHVAIQ